MVGIPIDGPGNVLHDDEAVVINTTHPESTLKKKHVTFVIIKCMKHMLKKLFVLLKSILILIWQIV